MDLKLIVVILSAVIAIGAVFYARGVKTDANSHTLSFLQALGAGIVGLGILLVAMPWAAGAIAQLGFITSSDFGILAGSVYAIGILALVGGIVLVVSRSQSEG
jgi:hypothetical protein